jgi:hypothetical protein
VFPPRRQLFLFARIVVRVHVVELQRGHAVDLDNDRSAGHRIMMHLGIEIGKTPPEKPPSSLHQTDLPCPRSGEDLAGEGGISLLRHEATFCSASAIVWARSWFTLACSIMLVRCMSADDPPCSKG